MAIKAQALADFIAEFTYMEEGYPNPEVYITKEGEVVENVSNMTRWKLFVDGLSNEHDSSTGLILQTLSSEQMEYAIRSGLRATNNEIEYETILAKLSVATKLGVGFLDIYSDSQLMVN
ncbi:hypothetical protein Acr_23g0011730 [Actinidia rufa]|uniref:RNase H type-1 domain-containing protein n=1 Tax=Actinidia rufa TaxID=165716 RepID=A0A7J0GPW1_9ERIC|nr:hypothetical protein Acr_23g0011730 [Actinidia rufa]